MNKLENIINNLNLLGLNTSALNFTKYLENANTHNISTIDFIDELLSVEAAFRRNKFLENKIKFSGFPARKTFEMFDFNFQPNLDQSKIESLRTLNFLKEKENIVFIGNPGVGKTHLSIAFGMLAIANKCAVFFINCHQLIQILKKANYENRLDERLKFYARFKLLIIDEIGYLPTDILGANLFFQLIARRYEKNSTIFTSNKMFSQWGDIFQDVTISSAILDRVLHHCHVIYIKGDSYRLRERKLETKENNSIMENDA